LVYKLDTCFGWRGNWIRQRHGMRTIEMCMGVQFVANIIRYSSSDIEILVQ